MTTPQTAIPQTIGTCQLHRGNCLDVLPTLPGSYDALITDPPYCSGGRTAAERQKPPSTKYVQRGTHAAHNVDFEGDTMDARSWTHWCAHWLALSRVLVKPGGYAMVFTDWRQLPALTDAIQMAGWQWRGIIAWDKGPGARGPHKGYFRHQCEYLVWASNGPLPAATHGGPWPGCYKVPVIHQAKLHMTGKPVDLMRDLVSVVPPHGHVLDPFMGSASTGVAALEAGRSFTGIEVTEHYFNVSTNRLQTALEATANPTQGEILKSIKKDKKTHPKINPASS